MNEYSRTVLLRPGLVARIRNGFNLIGFQVAITSIYGLSNQSIHQSVMSSTRPQTTAPLYRQHLCQLEGLFRALNLIAKIALFDHSDERPHSMILTIVLHLNAFKYKFTHIELHHHPHHHYHQPQRSLRCDQNQINLLRSLRCIR